MICDNCGNTLVKSKQLYEFDSRIVGAITIPDVAQYVCPGCGRTVLDAAEAERVLEYVDKEEQSAIAGLPIGEFISSDEAAEILGVTKQAFSKNSRIKRGFIHFVEIGGKKLYYRPSVEEFGRSGDGRICLAPAKEAWGLTKNYLTENRSYIIQRRITSVDKPALSDESWNFEPHVPEMTIQDSGNSETLH